MLYQDIVLTQSPFVTDASSVTMHSNRPSVHCQQEEYEGNTSINGAFKVITLVLDILVNLGVKNAIFCSKCHELGRTRLPRWAPVGWAWVPDLPTYFSPLLLLHFIIENV